MKMTQPELFQACLGELRLMLDKAEIESEQDALLVMCMFAQAGVYIHAGARGKTEAIINLEALKQWINGQDPAKLPKINFRHVSRNLASKTLQ